MRIRTTYFCLFLFGLLFCSACSQKEKAPVPAAVSTVRDTLPKIALTSTLDCLPFYWAERHGLYDRLGLNISISTYPSQFDCDSAVLGKSAVGGISDLVRVAYYGKRHKTLDILTATDNRWGLVVSHDLRVKSINRMKNYMIAVARYSASDLYSEQILKKNNLGYTDVFRPQINNYYLRTSMLNENQINAAVLPEPHLTSARLARNPVLAEDSTGTQSMGCFVVNPLALKALNHKDFTKKLLEGYNQAVDSLNKGGVAVCRRILSEDYKLSDETINALRLVHFEHARKPDEKFLKIAENFVAQH